MTASKRPSLIIVAAPSGTGKSTLCKRLLAEFDDKLKFSISSTTRAPRGSERHGKEYYFLDKTEFERKIQAGDFAEWAKVHDNYYGTDKRAIEGCFKRGQSVLLDIDVQGAKSLKEAFPDRSLLIFIEPPSFAELERRLRGRGTDDEETIQKRLKNARGEIAQKDSFDFAIVNDDLETAYAELKLKTAGRI